MTQNSCCWFPWRSHVSNVLCCMLLAVAGSAVPARAQATQVPGQTMMSWEPTLFILFDKLEYSPSGQDRPFSADMLAWYGGSRNRLWVLAEARQGTRGERNGQAEAEVRYGRLIDPFWDATAGVLLDRNWNGAGQSRVFLSAGLIGLAPYRFEFAPTLFVSSKGEISARLETGYQFLLTQRLIAEPEVEINAALQAVLEAGIRQGLNDYDLQLRIRYEFRREFAPYIGWSRVRQFGVRAPGQGEQTDTRFLVGLRLWR